MKIALVFVVALLLASCCGNDLHGTWTIEGRVDYDGKPIWVARKGGEILWHQTKSKIGAADCERKLREHIAFWDSVQTKSYSKEIVL